MAAHPQAHNPSGNNQFGTPPDAYGNVERLTELQKEAPMSGAPVPGITAPQRAQRAGATGRVAQQEAQNQAAMAAAVQAMQQASPTDPAVPPTNVTWQTIANIPGVSPVARQMAQTASGGGNAIRQRRRR